MWPWCYFKVSTDLVQPILRPPPDLNLHVIFTRVEKHFAIAGGSSGMLSHLDLLFKRPLKDHLPLQQLQIYYWDELFGWRQWQPRVVFSLGEYSRIAFQNSLRSQGSFQSSLQSCTVFHNKILSNVFFQQSLPVKQEKSVWAAIASVSYLNTKSYSPRVIVFISTYEPFCPQKSQWTHAVTLSSTFRVH